MIVSKEIRKIFCLKYLNILLINFFNIYNLYLNNDKKTLIKKNNKEMAYKICLSYFYKKTIIDPISFIGIGDLNRSIKRKNYSTFYS